MDVVAPRGDKGDPDTPLPCHFIHRVHVSPVRLVRSCDVVVDEWEVSISIRVLGAMQGSLGAVAKMDSLLLTRT